MSRQTCSRHRRRPHSAHPAPSYARSMDRSGDAILAALAGLLDRSHLAAPDALPDVVLACGRDLDWTVVIYLVDYEQRRLVPLVPSGTSDHVPEDIDSTLAG